ncbi:hypothetical protein [Streptomyces sp. SM1]|uniref:hypothetical protein n=1 Tax=Streptomyces sp. SM1 TaxID=402229 RepID=UPI001CA58876|nr:hypothetical protein [Streptomyces sp. SM1]
MTMDFVDSGLYRDITDYAQDSPTWVQLAAEIGTEAGLLVFVALFDSGAQFLTRSPMAAA